MRSLRAPQYASWRPDFSASASLDRTRLTAGAQLLCTPRYMRISFTPQHSTLSSAVLNGGFVTTDNLVNMRVDSTVDSRQPPDESIACFARGLGCVDNTVGMMTAASMKSLRAVVVGSGADELCAVVTSGLENARRAGDVADVEPDEYLSQHPRPPDGTINLCVVLGFAVPLATLVEIVTVAVEAKAAALQDLGVISPVSGRTATGTGTDAIAVASPAVSSGLVYAGKHTQLGERIARVVIESITDSVGSWGGT